VAQAHRRQDFFLKEDVQGFAADLFQRLPQDDEVGVRIVPVGPRGEDLRRGKPDLDQFLVGPCLLKKVSLR
jgi:hypothetical protein